MLRKIEKVLDAEVRPGLKSHGGTVELIDVDNNKLFIKMAGGCQGCSSAQTTVKSGIEKLIKDKFPMIEEVIDLTDHAQGTNPYYK
ncbi:hypothetical protein MHBO_004496 [Bonamia ostreae]|uniref:NIF system FeS cluster assembly NifU C-terminal domain-containing protein n=1 Tax=Bonamia ostreae TaxID=126728 RepID=A0ABV2ATY9_9EUKA